MGNISSQDMFKIFDASVKPILCYGSHIWGYQYVDRIEKVHIKFCKKLCLLSCNTCDFLALGECGRLPLCITYMSNCVKYWLHVVRMNNNRYPKQCYYMLFRMDETGKTTWATYVKNLLFSYGFGHVLIVHDVGNIDEFLKAFSQRIKDCYTQKWFADLNESPKALHYRYFKSMLTPELYLNTDLSYIQKKTLSNFRCSSHDLMVEKGRYLKIEREQRFCQLCKQLNFNIIEDEYRFFRMQKLPTAAQYVF